MDEGKWRTHETSDGLNGKGSDDGHSHEGVDDEDDSSGWVDGRKVAET